jgi:hypothetical protein
VFAVDHRPKQLAALPLSLGDVGASMPLVDLRPSHAPSAAQLRAGASLLGKICTTIVIVIIHTHVFFFCAELESCTLKVQRELTRRDDAVLLLVERVDDVTGVDFLADSTFALKVEAADDGVWERYVAVVARQRLAPAQHVWLHRYRSLELYDDAALLLLDHAALGTLADCLAAHRAAGKPLGEPLAVFYSIELLKLLVRKIDCHLLIFLKLISIGFVA